MNNLPEITKNKNKRLSIIKAQRQNASLPSVKMLILPTSLIQELQLKESAPVSILPTFLPSPHFILQFFSVSL